MSIGRRIVIVAALAAVLNPVCGQAFDKGIKAGINIANASLDMTAAPSTDAITGLSAGVFMSLGLGPIELEPDVLFTAKGYSYSDVSTLGTSDVTNKFNYVEIPVLLKWMIIPAGPVKPYVGAGPSIGFLMSAKQTDTLAGISNTTDMKDFLKGTDMTAVIEVGVRLGLAVVSIHADVRYAIGLADISDVAGFSAKNNVVSVLAGVGF